MNSWDRRLAAATRSREGTASASTAPMPQRPCLPTDLHADDHAALTALLDLAGRHGTGFSTTILARRHPDDRTDQPVRITVVGTEHGPSVLVGDDPDDLRLDPLSGLPGRDHLLASLDQALQHATDDEHSVAVCTVDIDRFKTHNDTRGFATGDDALCAMARRLEAVLGCDDVLARVGGDEFAIVRPDVLGVAGAMELAEQLRESCVSVEGPGPLHGLTVSVGVTLGTAVRGAEQTLRDAETALHQAKGGGRDRCEFFDDDLRSRAERHNTVDRRLRQALDANAVQVHYQPVVDLATDTIVGCEALLRIVGEDGARFDPVELVAAAEDGGLIRRIEETVLRSAADTVGLLSTVAGRPLWVSVNISDRRLLDSRFPLALARTLHLAGLPAEQLHLELHPDTLGRLGPGRRLLHQLRALGVGTVLDGYTGSGPVDHLTDGAVDLVKLDRRLVRGLGEPRGRVRAELAVAPLLEHGVGVCAVGVETRPELDAARSLGCRYAQGYLYSPPVDAARLRTVLSDLA